MMGKTKEGLIISYIKILSSFLASVAAELACCIPSFHRVQKVNAQICMRSPMMHCFCHTVCGMESLIVATQSAAPWASKSTKDKSNPEDQSSWDNFKTMTHELSIVPGEQKDRLELHNKNWDSSSANTPDSSEGDFQTEV
ncbi:hypothetical protein CHARACLAT_009388 [Characodon lateralis]|uniref:Uncharacterized protein n=1 Tax=Characodon lateralis TaxID=208331 RepID=A0ABU7CW86_9TELE|nr:hypothetical protein [Characodon lateralis]